MNAFVDEGDDDYADLYGVVGEQVQSKMELYKRQELMAVIPSMYSVSQVNAMDEKQCLKGW